MRHKQMTNTTINLQSEKHRIESDIEQLKADLSAVERLLLRRIPGTQLEIGEDDSINAPKKIGLTVAITGYFKDYQNKEWSPSDLRDWLVDLKRRNGLNSEAASLLTATHTVIRKLLNQKKIVIAREQIEPKPRKWYKWSGDK